MDYSEKKATELYEKYNVREKKLVHFIGVAKVAKFISERLVEKGFEIDPNKMYFAGLVHDIGDEKRSKNWDEDTHIERSYEILKEEGYDVIAEIIVKHGMKGYFIGFAPKTLEEKIIFISDKIFKKDFMTIESGEERHNQKFPDQAELFSKVYPEVKKIRNEILKMIEMSFEELVEAVKNSD